MLTGSVVEATSFKQNYITAKGTHATMIGEMSA
jgi:hypothetical protein